MEKQTLFSADKQSADIKNLNKLMVYTFEALFKVFAAASVVMVAFIPWVNFFDPMTIIIRDVTCFISIISLLILLIGRKNMNRWHFRTLLIFAVSFGAFTCLLLGPLVLAFTVPAMAVCGIIFLANRLRSQPVPYFACWIIMLLMILPVFITIAFLADGTFLAIAASVQMLFFTLLIMFSLKSVARSESPEDWKALARACTISFVICHALFANLSLFIGVIIWFCL